MSNKTTTQDLIKHQNIKEDHYELKSFHNGLLNANQPKTQTTEPPDANFEIEKEKLQEMLRTRLEKQMVQTT